MNSDLKLRPTTETPVAWGVCGVGGRSVDGHIHMWVDRNPANTWKRVIQNV